MRRTTAFVVGVFLGACGILAPPEPASDGEACSVDDDCESHTCYGASVCAFSSCNDGSDCTAGFTCDEPKQWVRWVSLGTAHGTCVPGCSVCPEGDRFSCDPAADARCWFDELPHVDAGGPYGGQVGRPVHLVATAELAPDRTIDTVQWVLDGQTVGDALEADVVFDNQYQASIALSVTDDEGSVGMASAIVQLCLTTGEQCNPYAGDAQCCEPQAMCLDNGDGTGRCG